MSKSKIVKRDLYYTYGHEWIDFQGSVAYIGIGHIKLQGVKQILKITFPKNIGFKKKDEALVVIHCNNCQVAFHMPVDGNIISFNETALLADQSILLEQPESNGWIAYIGLAQPYMRNGLMTPDQYKLFNKRKP